MQNLKDADIVILRVASVILLILLAVRIIAAELATLLKHIPP